MIMKYTIESHINSVKDVEAFFHHLVDDRKVNFHPDDDFADYITIVDKTSLFTNEEVSLYNRLMDECFDACETAGEDIYGIGFNVLKAKIA